MKEETSARPTGNSQTEIQQLLLRAKGRREPPPGPLCRPKRPTSRQLLGVNRTYRRHRDEAEMNTHLQSEHKEGGLSRRGLVQALAAGAAAVSVATPASAQQTSVLAEATSADYARDPTRW